MEIKGFHLFTFLFQVINFFILLLLLSRLLYRPLKKFMEKRQNELAKCFLDAENTKKEAMELAKVYEERLRELENKKEEILENKIKEAEEEAKKIIERARKEAQRIYEREKILLQREVEKLEAILKEKALILIGDLLERFFRELPLEDLHQILSERALKTLPAELEKLNLFNYSATPSSIEVITAFSTPQITDLIQKIIEERLQRKTEVSILEDSSLLAGIRLKIRGYVIDFSLRGQLNKLRKSLE